MSRRKQTYTSLQRPLPDNTQQTDIHAPGGMRTHSFSRRAAADLHLRPRGHWDWQSSPSTSYIFFSVFLRVLPTVFAVCTVVAVFCSSGLDLSVSSNFSEINRPLSSFVYIVDQSCQYCENVFSQQFHYTHTHVIICCVLTHHLFDSLSTSLCTSPYLLPFPLQRPSFLFDRLYCGALPYNSLSVLFKLLLGVFRDVTSYGLVDRYRRFVGTYFLRFIALRTEGASSFLRKIGIHPPKYTASYPKRP